MLPTNHSNRSEINSTFPIVHFCLFVLSHAPIEVPPVEIAIGTIWVGLYPSLKILQGLVCLSQHAVSDGPVDQNGIVIACAVRNGFGVTGDRLAKETLLEQDVADVEMSQDMGGL